MEVFEPKVTRWSGGSSTSLRREARGLRTQVIALGNTRGAASGCEVVRDCRDGVTRHSCMCARTAASR